MNKKHVIAIVLYGLTCATVNAEIRTLFVPSNLSEKNLKEITDSSRFTGICSKKLRGLDLVRRGVGLSGCPGQPDIESELLLKNNSLDFLFLVDDTQKMSSLFKTTFDSIGALDRTGSQLSITPTIKYLTNKEKTFGGKTLIVGEKQYQEEASPEKWLQLISQILAPAISPSIFDNCTASKKCLKLRLLGKDGDWLVFNKAIFRDEVISFFWGDRYTPREDELSSHESGYIETPDSGMIELGSSHWRIDKEIEGFNSKKLWGKIPKQLLEKIDHLPDITDYNRITNETQPDWISIDVWKDIFKRLRSGQDFIKKYPGGSSDGTAVVAVLRDGKYGGYAEMIEKEDLLYAISGVMPAGKLELFTGESSEQASIRWLAKANKEYNHFMWHEIKSGSTVRKAHHRYQNHIHTQLIITILKNVQRGSGSGTARAAEAAINAFQLVWGVIED